MHSYKPFHQSCSESLAGLLSSYSMNAYQPPHQAEEVPFLPLAERPVTGGKWLLGVAPQSSEKTEKKVAH